MGMELRISEIRNEKAKRAAYSIDNGDGVLKREELSVFQQKAQELGVRTRVINNIMDYFNSESVEQAEPTGGRQARREARAERREVAFDAVSEEAQRQRGTESGARYTSDVMDATREALRADGLTRDERIALRAFERSVVAADAGEVIIDAIMLQGNTEIEGTSGNTQTVSGQDVMTDEDLTNRRHVRQSAKDHLQQTGAWEDRAVRHEWRTGGFVGSAVRIQAAQNDVEQSLIQTTEEVMEELNTDTMALLSSLNGKTVSKRDANGQPIEGETIQLAYKDDDGNWHLDGLSQEIENVLGTDLQLNRDAAIHKILAEFTVLQGRLSTLVGENLSKEEVRELVRLCGFDIEPKDWQKILTSTLTGGAIGAGAGAIGSNGDQLIVTADRLIDLENVVNLGGFGQVIQDLQIPIAGEVILIPGNVATATALGAVIPAIIGLLNGLKDDGQKPVIPTNFNATNPADLVAELKDQNNPYAEVMGVLAIAFRKEDEDGKMVWDREGFLHFLNSAAGDQNVLLNKEELIGALMKIQRGEYQVDEEPEVPAKENPQEEVCDVQITPEQEIVEETLDLTYVHHRKGGDTWEGIVRAYYPDLVAQYGVWGKDGAIKRLQKALAKDENGEYNPNTFRAIITATDLPKEMKLPSEIEGCQRIINDVQAATIQSAGNYVKPLDTVGNDEYRISQVPGQTTYIARDMCNNSTASGSTPQEAFENLQDINPGKRYKMN